MKNSLYIHSLINRPILTHKSYKALEKNKYIFLVNKRGTKILIKQAIEEFFNVKVNKVNMMNTKGKKKVYRQNIGYRSDQKKAIVTLQQGYKITEIQTEQN